MDTGWVKHRVGKVDVDKMCDNVPASPSDAGWPSALPGETTFAGDSSAPVEGAMFARHHRHEAIRYKVAAAFEREFRSERARGRASKH